MPLAIGSEHELVFTDLLANGQAVGRVDAQVVFVWGPLPDERARIRIVETKKSYAVGLLLDLLETSPHRTTPFCPVFGTCGGCQVQHLAYDAQLAWKTRVVRDALERLGGFRNVDVGPTIGMDEPRAYRNKMALVVRARDRRIDFGFYQMRSHDFVPIAGCPVVLPELDDQIAALRAVVSEPSIAETFGDVMHAVARAGKSTGESVLTLTTVSPSEKLARAADAIASRAEGLVGLSNSFAPAGANAILGRKHRLLWGRAEMEERIPIGAGKTLRYRVSAASFFQINTEIVAKVFAAMSDLEMPSQVVDLYCGAGTFSMWFAAGGARVVGIEDNPAAIREAQANAALNALAERTSFLIGRVEEALARSPACEALEKADLAFLDPPRKGCEPRALDMLSAAKVPRIWYLSCNPATLARDLARLRDGGYRLESVQPYDMFPQTGHVEALVTMRRQEQTGGETHSGYGRP